MDDHPHDLMCGIAPRHIRVLCDNAWEGGYGYTPNEVGDMTPDQVFMLLMERKHLREKGRHRISRMGALELKPGPDGKVKGRSRDGKPIKGWIAGKSRAQQIREQAEAERDAAAETPKQRRSRQRQERAAKRAARKAGQQKSV